MGMSLRVEEPPRLIQSAIRNLKSKIAMSRQSDSNRRPADYKPARNREFVIVSQENMVFDGLS